jgi:hypothetical protein
MISHIVTIPNWLDLLLALPILTWRKLRYGYTFRKVPLTQGKFAIVDIDDFYKVIIYKWHTRHSAQTFYATCTIGYGRNRINLHMHRLIMNAPDDMFVDHINGNGWDNRKANLRLATSAQNNYNRRLTSNRTSKYKGVDYRPAKKAYRARITVDKRKIFLGHFKSEIEAACEYDKAAKKYHGEFAALNFPKKSNF